MSQFIPTLFQPKIGIFFAQNPDDVKDTTKKPPRQEGGSNIPIRDIKIMGALLVFCKQNDVYDMEGLANKVQHIHKEYYDTAGELKKVTRRIDTLALHLAHFENYKQHKAVYKKYMQLEPMLKGDDEQIAAAKARGVRSCL